MSQDYVWPLSNDTTPNVMNTRFTVCSFVPVSTVR